MKKKLAIELKNITKSYVLHHQKPTLSEQILRGRFTEKFTALDDVSLKIYQGEKVGIIGKNGSGKTTILKIIAGITNPNAGKVRTVGKVVSLIDLEAGFHPDLTGEENIFLNGLVIGMTRNQIKNKFAQIVAFADIGKFIDAQLYTYSQGMKLRLGFAIAVHSDPDVLILDEGIVVGDDNFQKKLSKKITELFAQKKTIIVVSHWLEFLKNNCNTILWVKNGKIYKAGNKSLLDEYAKSEK